MKKINVTAALSVLLLFTALTVAAESAAVAVSNGTPESAAETEAAVEKDWAPFPKLTAVDDNEAHADHVKFYQEIYFPNTKTALHLTWDLGDLMWIQNLNMYCPAVTDECSQSDMQKLASDYPTLIFDPGHGDAPSSNRTDPPINWETQARAIAKAEAQAKAAREAKAAKAAKELEAKKAKKAALAKKNPKGKAAKPDDAKPAPGVENKADVNENAKDKPADGTSGEIPSDAAKTEEKKSDATPDDGAKKTPDKKAPVPVAKPVPQKGKKTTKHPTAKTKTEKTPATKVAAVPALRPDVALCGKVPPPKKPAVAAKPGSKIPPKKPTPPTTPPPPKQPEPPAVAEALKIPNDVEGVVHARGLSLYLHEGKGNIVQALLAEFFIKSCLTGRLPKEKRPNIYLTRYPGEEHFGEYLAPQWRPYVEKTLKYNSPEICSKVSAEKAVKQDAPAANTDVEGMDDAKDMATPPDGIKTADETDPANVAKAADDAEAETIPGQENEQAPAKADPKAKAPPKLVRKNTNFMFSPNHRTAFANFLALGAPANPETFSEFDYFPKGILPKDHADQKDAPADYFEGFWPLNIFRKAALFVSFHSETNNRKINDRVDSARVWIPRIANTREPTLADLNSAAKEEPDLKQKAWAEQIAELVAQEQNPYLQQIVENPDKQMPVHQSKIGNFFVLHAIRVKNSMLLESFDTTGNAREHMENLVATKKGILSVNVVVDGKEMGRIQYAVYPLALGAARGFVSGLAKKYCRKAN